MDHESSRLPDEDRLFLLYRETGDGKHFTQLFLLVEQWILRIIFSYVKNEADARDVLQTAWENMLRNKDRFNPSKGSFRSLFYTIAVNAALQTLKKGKRTVQFTEDEHGLHGNISEPIMPDIRAQVSEALEQLRERYRTVIDLHYFGGFDIREISEIIDVPEGTVKTWLVRARSQLSRLLMTIGPLITVIDALRVANIWS